MVMRAAVDVSVSVTTDEVARAIVAGRGAGSDPDLSRLCKMFEDAEESSQDAREKAERDRDYYDGNQLTAADIAALEARGQAPIIVNRIKRKIDYLLGHERATRTDPKAYPRTQAEEGAAEAATDALRYVCDAEHFDVKRSAVWENLLVEGFGGVEVGARRNARGEVEPTITQIPWDRLFFDPHSRRPDFSDARYLGIVLWMDEEEAAELWPEAADMLAAYIDGSLASTYDDRPNRWVDGKRRRVRVIQLYYIRQGAWYLCFFTKGGMLREAEPVPYVDEDGRPECPLILQSGYIDRDLNRYGVVREMIGPQDEINKRRSKALHLISVRQTLGEAGAVADVDAAKREMARPDGHIEVAPGMRFEVLPTSDMAAAQFQLLQEAKNEIDLLGPNAAMQGKDTRAPSGRAILASQQGGAIELGPLTDALRQWQWRVYRQLWNRIKQFWDQERWIRVTDDENNLKWIGLNRPVTLGEKLQTDPEMMQRIEAARQQLTANNPALLQQFEAELAGNLDTPVEIANHVAALDVDISLEDAPDTVSLQAEQFEQLTQMAGAGLPIPPDVLIEASSLRNKKALLEKLKAPPPDPVQGEMAAATLRKLQTEGDRNEAMAIKTLADAAAVGAAGVLPGPGGPVHPAALDAGAGAGMPGGAAPMAAPEPGPVAPGAAPDGPLGQLPAPVGPPGIDALPAGMMPAPGGM